MLLDKIAEEFDELTQKIVHNCFFDSYERVFSRETGNERDVLLSWSIDMRNLTRIEMDLENKKYESKTVMYYVKSYLTCIDNLFKSYDITIEGRLWEKPDALNKQVRVIYRYLYDAISELKQIESKIKYINEAILAVREETWEPLPDDKKEDNVNNIIISSETRSMSLDGVASDINNLDHFFNNICMLVNQDNDSENNIYLRKVETGSLTVAISCAMEIGPIIGFIFMCVKLYQEAEKRHLDNEKRKLDLINDSMNMAKEILKIDPDNKEAEEVIQKCGIHILDFLKNNPMGTINGQYYDIGMEKPKIEDKENK